MLRMNLKKGKRINTYDKLSQTKDLEVFNISNLGNNHYKINSEKNNIDMINDILHQNVKNNHPIKTSYENKSNINKERRYYITHTDNFLTINCNDRDFYNHIKNLKKITLNTVNAVGCRKAPFEITNVKVYVVHKNYQPLIGKATINGYSVKIVLVNEKETKRKNIIQRDYNYSIDYFDFFDNSNVKDNLQLIKSANNHATRKHSVVEKQIKMVYFDKKRERFNTINIMVFYCEKCRKYFCFYQQFILELKQYNIVLNDFLAEFYDEYNNNLSTHSGSLRIKSILAKYGYSVSKEKKLNARKRFQILSFIIDRGIMSKAEVLSHIQYLINYNGKKESNKNAVLKWKEDIFNIVNKRN